MHIIVWASGWEGLSSSSHEEEIAHRRTWSFRPVRRAYSHQTGHHRFHLYRYHDMSHYIGISFHPASILSDESLYNHGRTENIPWILANLTSGMPTTNSVQGGMFPSFAAGNRIERFGYGAGKMSFSGCPQGGKIELESEIADL